MQAREDERQAKIIEQALLINAAEGAAHAWVYLTAHDVPGATIRRILSGPDQRRVQDNAVAHFASDLLDPDIIRSEA